MKMIRRFGYQKPPEIVNRHRNPQCGSIGLTQKFIFCYFIDSVQYKQFIATVGCNQSPPMNANFIKLPLKGTKP